MYYLLFIIFWIIGLVVGSFTLVQIVIILRFGIPITKKLERAGYLTENNPIIKRYLISIAILTIEFFCITLGTYLFINTGFVSLVVGIVWSFVFAVDKTGNNKNNFSDYLETNKQHFVSDADKNLSGIL